MRFSVKTSVLALAAGCLVSTPGLADGRAAPVQLAQLFNRPQPPADIDDDGPQRGPDTGAMVIRIERLENLVRSLTGQIEQLQFQIRRLEEQARVAPQANAQAPGAPIAAPVHTPQPTTAPALPPPVQIGAPGQTPPTPTDPRLRRNDAFDPAADPTAPGAPRPLGSTPSSAPIAATPGGPLAAARAAVPAPAPLQPMDLGQPKPPATAPVETSPGGTIIASTQPTGPKEEYELAAAFLKQGQYDQAEKGFSTFIAKNPKNRYVADAVFGLGETYFLRGRHREAAEQYLKISTNYSTSAKGAESLLRLGQSLNALGAKEQACASFSEIARKYPNAASTIRSADRESKKNSC